MPLVAGWLADQVSGLSLVLREIQHAHSLRTGSDLSVLVTMATLQALTQADLQRELLLLKT